MRRVICAATLTLFTGWGLPASAHHSSSMFEMSAVWVEGTVVRVDRVNPHAVITLEERDAGGRVRRWAIEGPSPVELDRHGIEPGFLKTGDIVRFCTFALKDEFKSLYASRSGDGEQRYAHGHVVIRNAQKSVWGSHGNLSECMRTSDEPRQAWVDFLNSDSRVGDTWCQQRRNTTRATLAVKAHIEEVNKLLARPCV